MYLFSRRTRIAASKPREGITWAAELTGKVREVTGVDVSLWMSVMSPAAGSIVWNAAVESLTDIEAANAKLNADDLFYEAAQRGADFTDQSLDDTVIQLIHGDVDPNSRPSYAAVVQSQVANGSLRRGIEQGIALATKAAEVGGLKTTFGITTTGAYAGVVWITGAESLSQLEAAEQATNMDPGFMELVDEASTCYLPGVTQQSLWQRVV